MSGDAWFHWNLLHRSTLSIFMIYNIIYLNIVIQLILVGWNDRCGHSGHDKTLSVHPVVFVVTSAPRSFLNRQKHQRLTKLSESVIMHRWSECECVKTHIHTHSLDFELFSSFKLITFIVCFRSASLRQRQSRLLFLTFDSQLEKISVGPKKWLCGGEGRAWRWRSSLEVLLWGFWWKWIEADGNRGTNRDRSINRETYWENERQIKD